MEAPTAAMEAPTAAMEAPTVTTAVKGRSGDSQVQGHQSNEHGAQLGSRHELLRLVVPVELASNIT
jgi:hypothetical protein